MTRQSTILSALILACALWCIMILAAPILKAAGFETISQILYSFFHRVCHQMEPRSFHVMGEPIAVCHRCSALYAGFLGMLIVLFAAFRSREFAYPSVAWLLLLVPMVLDVLLNDLGIHHGTMISRLVTGALAGGVLPFFILPPLIEAIQQLTHRNISMKGSQHVRETQ